MSQSIDSRLNELDVQLHAFLAELRTYSPTQHGTPDPFILKLAHFLMRSEASAFDVLNQEMLKHGNSKSFGWESSLKIYFTKMFLRWSYPTRTTIETIRNEDLPEKTSFWWVAKQWKAERVRLKAILASVPEESLHIKILEHPTAGKITVLDMLQYHEEYIKWHKKHIRNMWN